ncbi:NADH-quinone oxidoreductase subunit NuoI [Helicobacter sp. 14348-15]|uniref:NADH-quinone oxidoreductase subunit NuoI n=1 Tax=Helicobacter colisuis TaxID=2949739 RepID=UPI00202AF69D|nr:NADH-quinone oxidoreductase subunit NuoI [Helicobacter colisuis]MCL9820474.1 NADH-quinone oxidoreductase subunit NuoI [Helicobacter colisuis]
MSRYVKLVDQNPKLNYTQKFVKFWNRALKGELFVGLWLVLKELLKAQIHTVQYPLEKLPLSPRYRSVHELKRLLESGNERCIGCGLCEKICVSNCIRMETAYGEDKRKKVLEYTINFGRCIYCGLCAEVCPELAIVHGKRYENASEQRASFSLKEDMLTPVDKILSGLDSEYEGVGSVSIDADKKIKATPLKYLEKLEQKDEEKGVENV